MVIVLRGQSQRTAKPRCIVGLSDSSASQWTVDSFLLSSFFFSFPHKNKIHFASCLVEGAVKTLFSHVWSGDTRRFNLYNIQHKEIFTAESPSPRKAEMAA